MHKGFIKTASVIGALSVVLGAFAAHGLRQNFSDHILNLFETAVRYQFYHVFALLAAGILYKDFTNKFMRWAGFLFISGIILFSGSLYLLTYIESSGKLGYKAIGVITPVGGLFFIFGWICLFAGVYKHK